MSPFKIPLNSRLAPKSRAIRGVPASTEDLAGGEVSSPTRFRSLQVLETRKIWQPERIEESAANHDKIKWSGPGSNRRHRPFQGRALPTELPDHSCNRTHSEACLAELALLKGPVVRPNIVIAVPDLRKVHSNFGDRRV